MVKITLENGAVLEGSVEELRQMGVKFPEQAKPLVAGDYAKIVSATNFHCLTDGDIVEVIGGARYLMGGRQVRRLSDNKDQYVPAEQLIRATDEEVAEAKKPAQPETITHEGVEYKRVDREAREGDVVVFTETKGDIFENGTPYGPVNGRVKIRRAGYLGCSLYEVYKPHLNRTPASVKVYEPIVAKPAPLQVGDYAKVVDPKASYIAKVGEIVEIIATPYSAWDYNTRFLADRSARPDTEQFNEGEIVRATDEEVAEAKRQQAEKAVADKWADIGRNPNEFKKGDIVLVTEEGTHDFDEGETVTIYDIVERGLNKIRCKYVNGDRERFDYFYEHQLRLITPVEHRFDKPAGDSE